MVKNFNQKQIIWICLLLSVQAVLAQKQTSVQEQAWLGYIQQLRLSNHWGLTFDTHIRSKNNLVDSLSTAVFRGGAIYYLSDQVTLGAGYAYFHFFPADDHSRIYRPEHRPWQQIQWVTNYNRLRLQQRVRLEERFRRRIKNRDEWDEGYVFNYRVRYQWMLSLPLKSISSSGAPFSFYAGQELLLNFGKSITHNAFDHNRFHAGISWHVDEDDQLQLGYLNIFQQQSAGFRYRMIHVARIYYHHNIDLRKKQQIRTVTLLN